jgi:hypothetical protein
MHFKRMMGQLQAEILAAGEHLAVMPSLAGGVCANRYNEFVPCLWVNGTYRVCVEPAGPGPSPYGYALDHVPFEGYVEPHGWYRDPTDAALALAHFQVRDHLEMRRAYREGSEVEGG